MIPSRRTVVFAVLFCLGIARGASAAARPAVFFSDLTDGPTSGWEGSAAQGAAVSIWGANFGVSRGTSTVTVCGVTLNSDSDFTEWGATTNPATARGLQRVTFFLNSSMAIGANTITVTTSAGKSNSVPFYCRNTGNIYFVSRTGSDSNNGALSIQGSGTNGPWKTAGKARAVVAAGDAAYFKAGIYNEADGGYSSIVTFNNNHNNGALNNSITLASYPGEAAQLGDMTTPDSVINWRWTDTNTYWTISKFIMRAGTGYGGTSTSGKYEAFILAYGGLGTSGRVQNNTRIIGNDAQTYYSGGVCFTFGGAVGQTNLYVFGNYIHDCGSDYRNGPVDTAQHKAYGIYVGGYGSLTGVYIGWNEVAYNNYGHGIQIYGHTTDDWVDALYIHDNFIHHNAFRAQVFGGGDGGTGWNGTPSGTNYKWIRNAWFFNNVVAYNGVSNASNASSVIAVVGTYDDIIICGFSYGGYKGNYYLYNNTFYHAYATNIE